MVSGISGAGGAFNTQDLAAMREKMFKKADADGDGKISKEEMKAAAPKDESDSSFEEMFSKIDAGGDGYITEAEDETAAAEMQKKGPPPGGGPGGPGGAGGPPDASQMASDMFADADEDEDGSISVDDLSNIIPTDGAGPSAEEIFSTADADGDGKISQSDLEGAMKTLMEKKTETEATGYTASGLATYASTAASTFSISV